MIDCLNSICFEEEFLILLASRRIGILPSNAKRDRPNYKRVWLVPKLAMIIQ